MIPAEICPINFFESTLPGSNLLAQGAWNSTTLRLRIWQRKLISRDVLHNRHFSATNEPANLVFLKEANGGGTWRYITLRW